MSVYDNAPTGRIEADPRYLLYRLLQERDETVNISHKKLPSIEDHIRFFESRPYEAWYLYRVNGDSCGAVYLTRKNEIGVFIFKDCQGKGHGKRAVQMLMEKHGPLPYLANINPANERSIRLFKSLGFAHIQNTYQCKPVTD